MRRIIAKLANDSILAARGWRHGPALRELERLQWAEPGRVQEIRVEKLQRLLSHVAASVPFYESAFREVGADPREIRGIEELGFLPIVSKQILGDNYDAFIARGAARGCDEWASSGSTGEPFRFRLDKTSIAANVFAALARGRRWWDVDYGVREAMIWSGVRDISGTAAGRFAAARRRFSWGVKNIKLIDTYNLDRDAVRRAYEGIRHFKPVVIRAISSGLFRFCATVRELGLDGKALGVRCAIFTGEAFPPAQRRLAEEVLGCPTVCEYGCTELGIIAFECPDRGLHLNHENFFFEFLKDGRPARAGEEAELIATNLNALRAPLIRYAVGDIVVPSDESCACGRTLPLISGVGGRAHDSIVNPRGGVVHGLFFTHIFDQFPDVQQFRVIQDSLTTLKLDLRSTQSISKADMERIRAAVLDMMGDEVKLELEQVDDIPVSPSGKLHWIISNVKLEDTGE